MKRPIFGRIRKLLLNGGLVVGSLLVAALLLEVLFRLFPVLLPSGHYGWGRFDPELQMNVIGGPIIYNKARRIRRVPNRHGFLDVDHDMKRVEGTLRVGFFGDSYVEALQVSQEQVFFRRMPSSIAGRPVELFGFGIGGWGMVHSYRNHQLQAPRYDLDIVAYLFVENDLGENSYLLHQKLGQRGTYKPYARLADNEAGFELAWLRRPEDLPLWYRAAKILQGRSLLAQFLNSRLSFIRQAGISVRSTEEMRQMTETAGEIPESRALPSTWPEFYTRHVQDLGERILARWASEARQQGRHFFVFYVPRNEAMLDGTRQVEETWRPWLGETCAALGIPLVDPREAMAARLAQGTHVYDDHWTPAGHEVVAGVLAGYLEGYLEEAARPGRDD